MITSTDYYYERSVCYFMYDQALGLHLQSLCHAPSPSNRHGWPWVWCMVLLTIKFFNVVLQPCGFGYQHHTWCVVEVIELSMSASSEECMHAFVGENYIICWPLVCFPGCLSKSPLWLGHFPQFHCPHSFDPLPCNLPPVLVSYPVWGTINTVQIIMQIVLQEKF